MMGLDWPNAILLVLCCKLIVYSSSSPEHSHRFPDVSLQFPGMKVKVKGNATLDPYSVGKVIQILRDFQMFKAVDIKDLQRLQLLKEENKSVVPQLGDYLLPLRNISRSVRPYRTTFGYRIKMYRTPKNGGDPLIWSQEIEITEPGIQISPDETYLDSDESNLKETVAVPEGERRSGKGLDLVSENQNRSGRRIGKDNEKHVKKMRGYEEKEEVHESRVKGEEHEDHEEDFQSRQRQNDEVTQEFFLHGHDVGAALEKAVKERTEIEYYEKEHFLDGEFDKARSGHDKHHFAKEHEIRDGHSNHGRKVQDGHHALESPPNYSLRDENPTTAISSSDDLSPHHGTASKDHDHLHQHPPIPLHNKRNLIQANSHQRNEEVNARKNVFGERKRVKDADDRGYHDDDKGRWREGYRERGYKITSEREYVLKDGYHDNAYEAHEKDVEKHKRDSLRGGHRSGQHSKSLLKEHSDRSTHNSGHLETESLDSERSQEDSLGEQMEDRRGHYFEEEVDKDRTQHRGSSLLPCKDGQCSLTDDDEKTAKINPRKRGERSETGRRKRKSRKNFDDGNGRREKLTEAHPVAAGSHPVAVGRKEQQNIGDRSVIQVKEIIDSVIGDATKLLREKGFSGERATTAEPEAKAERNAQASLRQHPDMQWIAGSLAAAMKNGISANGKEPISATARLRSNSSKPLSGVNNRYRNTTMERNAKKSAAESKKEENMRGNLTKELVAFVSDSFIDPFLLPDVVRHLGQTAPGTQELPSIVPSSEDDDSVLRLLAGTLNGGFESKRLKPTQTSPNISNGYKVPNNMHVDSKRNTSNDKRMPKVGRNQRLQIATPKASNRYNLEYTTDTGRHHNTKPTYSATNNRDLKPLRYKDAQEPAVERKVPGVGRLQFPFRKGLSSQHYRHLAAGDGGSSNGSLVEKGPAYSGDHNLKVSALTPHVGTFQSVSLSPKSAVEYGNIREVVYFPGQQPKVPQF